MPATKRVVYSVDSEVAARFEATFMGRERSRAIERLMLRALAERESEVVAAAQLIETDHSFAEAAAVSNWADAQAADLLSRR
jgi:hypothetical protein